MKSFLMAVLLLLTGLVAGAQDVKELLAKFEDANGGRQKLKAIKTLQVESVMKMSIMGQSFDININAIRERGKLYRREISGIMGMGNSWTMITDTAGYNYLPSLPNFGGMQGSSASLNKMADDELKQQLYELDCAGAFGPLVDYAAKGHQAEYLGMGKVNKQDCYKIKLTLASGGSLLYFIDTTANRVQMVQAAGDMAVALTGFGGMMKLMGGGRMRNITVDVQYSDYKDFGGIAYPMKQVINLGQVVTTVENMDVKINEPVDEVWYRVK